MSLEPLKKELESIDLELESAMQLLSETSQRVDDLLADFSADEATAARARRPPLVLHTSEATEEVEDESASKDSDSQEDDNEEEVAG